VSPIFTTDHVQRALPTKVLEALASVLLLLPFGLQLLSLVWWIVRRGPFRVTSSAFARSIDELIMALPFFAILVSRRPLAAIAYRWLQWIGHTNVVLGASCCLLVCGVTLVRRASAND
jgi:hypothetical protein